MNPCERPTSQQLEQIFKQLKEDEVKMEHYIQLFKDWLAFQKHLPQEIDENFISNFIRLCKMDLRRAKMKFESCVISTFKHQHLYPSEITESFFMGQSPHKMYVPLPKMTPDGHRVFFFRENDPSAKNFDLLNLVRYALVLAIYVLFEDKNAGMEAVFDLSNISLQHAKHLDVKLLSDTVEIMTEMFPFRLISCYVLNLPSSFQTFFQWAVALLPQKMGKRVKILKDPKDLVKYFPEEILPENYYGAEKSIDILGNEWMEYILKSDRWSQKLQKLKLVGPIPKTKQWNGADMEGSFRQLSID